MKTRTVEIPLCDKCSQDGELYVITDILGKPLLKIARCDRHLHRLAYEASVTNDGAMSKDGDKPLAPLAEGALMLFDLIKSEPNLTNAEYTARHPEGKASWGRAPLTLEERGLITITTDRNGAKHYAPIGEAEMSETSEEVLDAETEGVSA